MDRKNKKYRKCSSVSANGLLLTGIIFLVVFCVSGYFLLRYYREYRGQKELERKIADLGTNTESGMDNKNTDSSVGEYGRVLSQGERNHQAYRDVNPDYIGFLTVWDTDIRYPVVWKDNTYYLNHDFWGQKNRHGTIFLDEACSVEDMVVLIHGHHMKDKTMFGGLKNYEDEAFRASHRQIYLDLGDGDQSYVVFGAALVDLTQTSFFHYEQMPKTEEERTGYLQQLRNTSFWYDEDVIEGCDGQILLLSTCEYATEDQRLIVAAVLADEKNRMISEDK